MNDDLIKYHDAEANIDSTDPALCTSYIFPPSLLAGSYHLRINATIVSPSDTQLITSCSPTIIATSNQPLGCGTNQTPGPWPSIPSINSTVYTSMYLTSPAPGLNIVVDKNAVSNGYLDMGWRYRDDSNALAPNYGISDLAFQILKAVDNTPINPNPIPINNLDLLTHRAQFKDIGLSALGAYKVRVSYVNKILDGLVGPGGKVEYTSQEFNVVESGVECSGSSQPDTSRAEGGSIYGARRGMALGWFSSMTVLVVLL